MKIFLLPENGNSYKANLHCHTTLSDGSLSPEEVKSAYKKHGYSVVAFSDHDKCYSHDDLTDENFLALNAYEVDISQPRTKPTNHIKCYHLNCFDKIAARKEKVLIPPYPAYDDIGGINDFISKVKSDGFMVSYNHPHWSLQNLDDYRELEGCFALEIFNYGAFLDGSESEQVHVYDDFLRANKRVYCLATDDNHDRKPFDDPLNDSFGGYVFIKAEKLTYDTIISALENGDFYSSRGPLIDELYIDGNTVSIKTSPVKTISLSIAGRNAHRRMAKAGESITSASFTLDPNDDVYFRLELIDHHGDKAHTNAYFFDELKK